MEMPKPTEQHKKLYRFSGNWVGDEKLNPSPWGPGGTRTGRLTGRLDIEGFFVIQDYIQENEGRACYHGHGIFSWDETQKCYAWYWFDSMGFVPPAPSRGKWEGDTLMFEHEPGGADGERRGRYTYRWSGDDAYYFKIENSTDGGQTWMTFMEADYRRA
jgi:hypothetical protein